MTRIGIVGYGNLARGVECSIAQNADMDLAVVFTRRDPASLTIRTPGVPVASLDDVLSWKDKVDVLILCGGSATDLPTMTPALAKEFHVIDSFDTHANIPAHFAAVDAAAKASGHMAMISLGWDPGLFSVNRLYASAILPEGKDYTFWGKGVSQGHSDAVRRIPGVADARQYTIPVPEALERVRKGENPELTTREKHTRYCYVVAEEGADKAAIETAIKTMPNYFADYDTTVEFITAEEMKQNHSGLPHGGSVIRSGVTGWEKECHQTIEYKLTLDSNPQFTASVLVACARALNRMKDRGCTGCYTIFDIAPADLSPLGRDELLAHML
ncbi:MAG TPA: diaminopimelate dehydrogenase [Candidatus Avoscillospira avistercoris]|uniref:Meso-diaminopimelate D-dehydrogenase n=1 Tax=Candidatus Avoscillospira avistercoris TaxID=2840707 RepID=A0A9D1FAN0_9FIRM|nr:diaminopimelate dehydrogenase [Candidatus Avoscillospira avistercoris]